MSNPIEVKVPDIGDYKNIPVIEVFVKVGDTVAVEDTLITLESDKATLDVPSSHAGIVKEIKVKVGDKISEGSVVVMLEVANSADAPSAKPTPAAQTDTAGNTTPVAPAVATEAPPAASIPIPVERELLALPEAERLAWRLPYLTLRRGILGEQAWLAWADEVALALRSAD